MQNWRHVGEANGGFKTNFLPPAAAARGHKFRFGMCSLAPPDVCETELQGSAPLNGIEA